MRLSNAHEKRRCLLLIQDDAGCDVASVGAYEGGGFVVGDAAAPAPLDAAAQYDGGEASVDASIVVSSFSG